MAGVMPTKLDANRHDTHAHRFRLEARSLAEGLHLTSTAPDCSGMLAVFGSPELRRRSYSRCSGTKEQRDTCVRGRRYPKFLSASDLDPSKQDFVCRNPNSVTPRSMSTRGAGSQLRWRDAVPNSVYALLVSGARKGKRAPASTKTRKRRGTVAGLTASGEEDGTVEIGAMRKQNDRTDGRECIMSQSDAWNTLARPSQMGSDVRFCCRRQLSPYKSPSSDEINRTFRAVLNRSHWQRATLSFENPSLTRMNPETRDDQDRTALRIQLLAADGIGTTVFSTSGSNGGVHEDRLKHYLLRATQESNMGIRDEQKWVQ
ncbi:hypothetical protein M407DRAFT_213387 [Tulasnella calospora MUT 4182]|uniref:Uncharacterized protein n=1 Tax=Tulasnella calospora MUT 4182 TaxID=1051891 RepID=A0A0C3Q4T9_9AGAM|nr:hypothetical protein M407DRAFT_213387 [Tulasnella calospora MUT 4182]